MKIGIDISQLAYPHTGVSNYLKNWLEALLSVDNKNEYVLFFSSLRGELSSVDFLSAANKRVKIKRFKLPPTVLDFLWNKLHILPIEWFIGRVDILISSDWTQPPTEAKKATILYDLIVYKFPNEMDQRIVSTQRRRLQWVKKEVNVILCISEATKKDAMELLKIPEEKLVTTYPGI